MNAEKRVERVNSRISSTTKLKLKSLKESYGISTGDILTNFAENECNDNGGIILIKLKMLDDRLKMVERLEREMVNTLDFLKQEQKSVKKEIKSLEQLKPKTKSTSVNAEENVKRCVKSYFDTRNQHTTIYGEIDAGFDTVRVGKVLCGRYGLDYDVLVKSIELIDNGVELTEFMSSDISEFGLIDK